MRLTDSRSGRRFTRSTPMGLLLVGKPTSALPRPRNWRRCARWRRRLANGSATTGATAILSPEEVSEREVARASVCDPAESAVDGRVRLRGCDQGENLTAPWADIDDQVLLKSDGFPTYHLANVVDDRLMQITHVIRGDEWMSSTPKHLLLYEAFGWAPPVFMHMPLLLGKEGKNSRSERTPPSIFYFRDSGYLPEALLNFLTLMGYSMPDEKELYSLDEIISSFDPKRIGTSGAFFDIQKLNWVNQKKLIETIPEGELWHRLSEWSFNETFMRKLMPLIHTRIKTFGDFLQQCDFFFINELKITPELLTPKGASP